MKTDYANTLLWQSKHRNRGDQATERVKFAAAVAGVKVDRAKYL